MSLPDLVGRTENLEGLVEGASRQRSRLLHALLGHPSGRLGVFLLLLVALFVAFGGMLAPTTPYEGGFLPLSGPSATNWFGTDEIGRDLFSRVVSGLRTTLAIALTATLLGAVVGGITGVVSGYVGGWVDSFFTRVWDVVLAFPSIIFAIAVAAILGQGGATLIIAIASTSLPQFARLARAGTRTERSMDYVTADFLAGGSTARVLGSGILPNVLNPLIVYYIVALPNAAALEATLSFLGLGMQPPTPTLGGMISASRQFLTQAPTYAVFPGVVLFVVIIAITLIGFRVSDVLDPSRKAIRRRRLRGR